MPRAIAQLELVAVDRRGVEMVAAARLERHFQVAEPVDGLLADRPPVQARDHLGLGAGGIAVGIQDRHHGPLDEVAARALHREGLSERAILDSARVGPLVGREVDRHLARDEVAREQVAERSVADVQRCAGRESDARTAEAGECELTAVDRRRDERAARARGEGDVDERPVVGGAQIAEVAGLAGLRAARGGARVGPGVREEVGSQRHRPTGIVGQRHDDREVEGVGGPDLNRGAAGIELDRPVAVRDHDVELRAGIGHRCGIELESGEEAGRDIRNRHAQHARQVRAEAEGLVEVGIRVRIVDALFGRRGRIGVLVRDHDRRSGTAGTFRALVPALIDELVLDDDSRERRRTRIHVDLVAIDRVRHLGRRHGVVEGHRPVGRTQHHRHEDLVDHDFLGGGAGVRDRALDDFLAVVGDREDDGEELLGIAEGQDVLGGRRHAILRRRRPENESGAIHLRDHEGVVLGRRDEPGGGIDGGGEPPGDVVGILIRQLDHRVGVGRSVDRHLPDVAGSDAAHHHGLGGDRSVGDARRSASRQRRRQVEPAAADLRDDQRGALGARCEPHDRIDLAGEPMRHAGQRIGGLCHVLVVGAVNIHDPIAGSHGAAECDRLRRPRQVRHARRRRQVGELRTGAGRQRGGDGETRARSLAHHQGVALPAGLEVGGGIEKTREPRHHVAEPITCPYDLVVARPVDGQCPRVTAVDGTRKDHSRRAGNRRRRREAGIGIGQVEVGDVEGPGIRQHRERHLARGRERAGEPVAERLGVRARADDHRGAAVVEHDRAEPVAGEGELRRQVGDRAFVDGEPGGARRRREGHVDIVAVVDRVDVDRAAGARIGERGGGAFDGERRDDLVVRRAGDHVAVLQRDVGVLEAASSERHRHRADREVERRVRRA